MNDREEKALKAYKTTINQIDDWFEYANESKKDRDFIHAELDKLTAELLKIYKGTQSAENLENGIMQRSEVINNEFNIGFISPKTIELAKEVAEQGQDTRLIEEWAYALAKDIAKGTD